MNINDIPKKYLNNFYNQEKIDHLKNYKNIKSRDDLDDLDQELLKPKLQLWTITLAIPSMPRFNRQYFIDKDVAHKWAIYWMWQNYFEGIVAEPLTVRAIGENQWKNLDIENLIYGDPPYTFNYPLGSSEIEWRNNYLNYIYNEQPLNGPHGPETPNKNTTKYPRYE